VVWVGSFLAALGVVAVVVWVVLVWSAWRHRSLLEAAFALILLVAYSGVAYGILFGIEGGPD